MLLRHKFRTHIFPDFLFDAGVQTPYCWKSSLTTRLAMITLLLLARPKNGVKIYFEVYTFERVLLLIHEYNITTKNWLCVADGYNNSTSGVSTTMIPQNEEQAVRILVDRSLCAVHISALQPPRCLPPSATTTGGEAVPLNTCSKNIKT